MISRRFFLLTLKVFLFCLLTSSPIFSYELSLKTDNDSVGVNTSTSVASKYFAFLLLKASLEKNNISYQFNTNGLYYSVNGYEKQEAFTINGKLLNLSGYSTQSIVVLWPRDPLDREVIDCDYSIVLTAGLVRPTGDTSSLQTYCYYDFGVVRLTRWIGDYLQENGAIDFSTKQIDILSNVTNSMPILFSDKYINYFSNKFRIYNITYQNSASITARGDLKNKNLGSMAELQSQVGSLLYLTGSTNASFRTIDSFSLQTGEIMYQSQLPWQLQIYNNDYTETEHLKPSSLTAVDTDGGTEPDWSEYFNAHDYENPDDDWGQPAEIGGGSDGAGGEVTSYGPQAQSQMTSSVQEAIENAIGSTSVTTPQLPSTSPTNDKDEIDLDDNWLTTAGEEVSDILPTGIAQAKRILEALKNPPSGRLPVFTLPLAINLGSKLGNINLGGVGGASIDFNVLVENQSYHEKVVLIRKIVVLFLFICTILYIIKDAFMLGGSSE